MSRLRRPRAALLGLVALASIGVALALRRARLAARGVPLSPLTADRRVGPGYPERRGVVGPGDPVGEMDSLDAYARPDFDPGAVHPAVRRFYERTADYRMTYRVRWERGFRLGAALAAPLTTRIEQLNLPGPREAGPRRLANRFVDVAPAADPREGVRAWVRTDPESGNAVFVALYGAHEADGERLVNIAAPLPGASLGTVLRPEHLPLSPGGHEATGLELTTLAPGHPGLYLTVPPLSIALPLNQRFRVWPADAPNAPPPPGGDAEPDLVATHEMWVLGRRFLTVTYGIERADQVSTSAS